jgi:hypothetical protein
MSGKKKHWLLVCLQFDHWPTQNKWNVQRHTCYTHVTHAMQHTCYTHHLSIHVNLVRINKFSSCASSLKLTETSSTKYSLATSREVSVVVQEVTNFALAPRLRPVNQVHLEVLVEYLGVVCWDQASELLHTLNLRKEQANRTEQSNSMTTTELSQHEWLTCWPLCWPYLSSSRSSSKMISSRMQATAPDSAHDENETPTDETDFLRTHPTSK